jgi:nucleotide-binding universal stress UspA family protein
MTKKTIVVATDFSPNANRVACFAAQLARDWKAKLTLLNTYHFWPDNPAKTGDFPMSREAMREESRTKLSQLADHLHEYVGADLPIHWIAQEGQTLAAIRAVTLAEQADLLVMSTVGTAPHSVQFLGSVATDMIDESNVPLLLVPPTVDYTAIHNLVMGVDPETPPNAIALDTAIRFARQFNSVVNVVCVSQQPTDPTIHQRTQQIREMMLPVPHTLTVLPGDDVFNTLIGFAHNNKADLVVMLPQPRQGSLLHRLERLFTDSETERMARLTDVPLLVVA